MQSKLAVCGDAPCQSLTAPYLHFALVKTGRKCAVTDLAHHGHQCRLRQPCTWQRKFTLPRSQCDSSGQLVSAVPMLHVTDACWPAERTFAGLPIPVWVIVLDFAS